MLKIITHDRNIWTLHERLGTQHHPSPSPFLAYTTLGRLLRLIFAGYVPLVS